MTSMFAVLFAAALSVSPMPQMTDAGNWWSKRLADKKKLVEAGGSKVVFLGDSSAHFFEMGGSGMGRPVWDCYWAGEPHKALNLGFSGDRTENLLWRITEGGELDGYDARAIILSIGTNNTGYRNDPAGDTIIGVKRILEVIRAKQPDAVTVLCAILPRGERPDNPMRVRNAVVNRELQKYADGRKVVWCDFSDRLLFADGTLPAAIMPDFHHMREEGYRIWTAAVLPYVNAIMRGEPMPLASAYPSSLCREAFHDGKTEATRAVTRIAQPSWRGADWWGDRFMRNRMAVRDRKGKIDIVFAGDSITHFWEDYGGKEYAALTNRYSILNLGYGGDQTQNLLWRFRHGELDGYRAKAAMLMIGTNNNGIGGYNPEHTVDGVRACLDVLREKQPQAKVFLMGYLPRAVGTADGDPAKDGGADGRNRISGEKLRSLADGRNVVYVDMYDRFLVDGKIPKSLMGDYIHPTEKGYAIWRECMEPEFRKVVGK